MKLDYLDTIALETAHFFAWEKENIKPIDIDSFSSPLVLGSGNAIETGKILFRKKPALFASESDAVEKIVLDQVREVMVISASGGKHAPYLVNLAKENAKITHLISSTRDSAAAQIAENVYIFPKISEPYTYNTSTYFAYLYGSEKENYSPEKIAEFLEKEIETELAKHNLVDFTSFFIVIPNEFTLLKNMIEMKFIELFGRKVARDVATYEQVKHAMTIIPDEKELFIAFGNSENAIFGKNQINLPIFDRENYGPMMLAAYFTVGKIQRALPNYFMDNIEAYCANHEYNISPLVKA